MEKRSVKEETKFLETLWQCDPRWSETTRPYSAKDVVSLRGCASDPDPERDRDPWPWALTLGPHASENDLAPEPAPATESEPAPALAPALELSPSLTVALRRSIQETYASETMARKLYATLKECQARGARVP